jgi:ElaB/YqjD/DUF883 family membrane-anchored ribosome-binding protein
MAPSQSMTTMQINVARMLATKSNIVDIGHENELRRGLTTSGQPQRDDDDQNKTSMTQKLKEEAQRAGARGKEMAQNMKENVKETVQAAKEGVKETAQNTKESMMDTAQNMKDTAQRAGENVKASARKMNDLSKDAAQRLNGTDAKNPSSIDMERTPGSYVEAPGDNQPTMSSNTSFNEQPGTGRLRGTNDNFNDDPGVSIDQAQETIRATKDKITGGADHVLDSVKGVARDTTNAVKQKAQEVKESAKTTMTKAKEVLTGEKEKPDESKSEVRSKESMNKGDTAGDTRKRGSSWQ